MRTGSRVGLGAVAAAAVVATVAAASAAAALALPYRLSPTVSLPSPLPLPSSPPHTRGGTTPVHAARDGVGKGRRGEPAPAAPPHRAGGPWRHGARPRVCLITTHPPGSPPLSPAGGASVDGQASEGMGRGSGMRVACGLAVGTGNAVRCGGGGGWKPVTHPIGIWEVGGGGEEGGEEEGGGQGAPSRCNLGPAGLPPPSSSCGHGLPTKASARDAPDGWGSAVPIPRHMPATWRAERDPGQSSASTVFSQRTQAIRDDVRITVRDPPTSVYSTDRLT